LRRAAICLAAVALAGCGGAEGLHGTGAGSLPFDGRSPLVPPARHMRVLVELKRPSLAEKVATEDYSPVRQRLYVASLANEAKALQGALEAKGVRLRRPVEFGRVWNGFAATMDSGDLPQLRALGLSAEPVRRFYGAAGAAGPTGPGGSVGQTAAGEGGGRAAVALLDFGAHARRLREVLVQAMGPGGGKVKSIRVGGSLRDTATGGRIEAATTDQLLEGLERAVDPNGDGDTSDHVPVALVGVNSPYAGFADSPEAVGASAARAFGTLVVAPAGNEGPAASTVGSPAAAPGVLAVGALEGGGTPALPEVELGVATGEGRALVRGTLLGGAAKALKAPLATLTGPSQARPKERGRATGGGVLEYFAVNATPRAKGKAVVVPARGVIAADDPPLSARAQAAAEAGAAALIVCEPDPSKPLTAIPGSASGPPVIGVRGSAARKLLDLTPRDEGLAFVSAPERQTAHGPPAPAPTSSRGPTYALGLKPDISAPGTARLADGTVVAGTSVAAARAAAAAAAVHAARPGSSADDVAASLTGTARPLGSPLQTGAGALDAAKAPHAAPLIEPATLSLPRQQTGSTLSLSRQFSVKSPAGVGATVKLAAQVPGLTASLAPPTLTLSAGAKERVTLGLNGGATTARFATGRLTAGSSGAPLGLPIGPPPAPHLGPLTLMPGPKGTTVGVRFSAGAVTTENGARSAQPLGNLRLALTDDKGRVVRRLTARGGAENLLPGEYAYTLTKAARDGLGKGSYSFVADARGTAGGPELTRESPSFTVGR
jgi:Subtilase family